MEFTEAELIAEKVPKGDYMPLKDYFLLWLLVFGRVYSRRDYDPNYAPDEIENKLFNTEIWDWRMELEPLGYLEITTGFNDTAKQVKLTDKAMALIRERASDD